MTESEWWAATDPDPLIDYLFFDRCATDRRLRLFCVAACGPIAHLVDDPQLLHVLRLSEAFADGGCDWGELLAELQEGDRRRHARWLPSELASAREALLFTACKAEENRNRERADPLEEYYVPVAALIAKWVVEALVPAHRSDDRSLRKSAIARLVHLLHDIFGPLPFRDIAVPPSWLMSDVLALARGIYEEKAFDRMPILADALQDAGCDNADLLTHCRAENWEHVRGCWVIDLLLGRPWREET